VLKEVTREWVTDEALRQALQGQKFDPNNEVARDLLEQDKKNFIIKLLGIGSDTHLFVVTELVKAKSIKIEITEKHSSSVSGGVEYKPLAGLEAQLKEQDAGKVGYDHAGKPMVVAVNLLEMKAMSDGMSDGRISLSSLTELPGPIETRLASVTLSEAISRLEARSVQVSTERRESLIHDAQFMTLMPDSKSFRGGGFGGPGAAGAGGLGGD
jgi:hypothetical protein